VNYFISCISDDETVMKSVEMQLQTWKGNGNWSDLRRSTYCNINKDWEIFFWEF